MSFDSIIEGVGGTVTPKVVFLCILSAIILGGLLSILYLYTHRKTGATSGYVSTTVILPAIAAIIIMLIGDNVARAFSLAGAFALIRYRSVAGDPNDICYIFFALALGVTIGLGYIGYATMFFFILAIIIVLMHISHYGESKKRNMTLKITIPENLNYHGVFDNVLNHHTSFWKLIRVKTVDFGSLFDLVYAVTLYDDLDEKEFIDKLRTLNGNLNITLVLTRNEDVIYG
jgi:cation transport ATPase